MQLPNLLERLCISDIKGDDRDRHDPHIILYFMHFVYFKNETYNCVSSVMETGLDLQSDIFPRKHEKHKLKTILFLEAGLMYPRVQVRIQTCWPTFLADTFRGVPHYSKKILR